MKTGLGDQIRDNAEARRVWRYARRGYSDGWLGAESAHLVTATRAVSNNSVYINMAAGATSDAHWNIWKKPLWQLGGSLRFTVVYSGTTANAGLIDLRLATTELKVGDDYTTGLGLNQTDTFAGPGTADRVLVHEFEDLFPVAGNGVFIPIRLRRVNTDAYTGAFRAFGLSWEYLSKR